MKAQHGHGFLSGMLLGVGLSLLTGLVGVYLLVTLDIVAISVVDTPGVHALSEWTRRNLGLSVVPFGITLGLYIHSLRTLASERSGRVEEPRDPEQWLRVEGTIGGRA